MHEAYWGLKSSPFRAWLDPRFYHNSATHDEALSRLRCHLPRDAGLADTAFRNQLDALLFQNPPDCINVLALESQTTTFSIYRVGPVEYVGVVHESRRGSFEF